MPKFAANLSMTFTEVPFLDRFAAASDAGVVRKNQIRSYAAGRSSAYSW
jgi:hydroxypyruvate isomerase